MSLETDTAEKIGKILAHVENHTKQLESLACAEHSKVIEQCKECIKRRKTDNQTIRTIALRYIGQSIQMAIVAVTTYFLAGKVGGS